MSLAHLQIMWSIGRFGRNKPTDIAAAQVLLNLAARPGIPPLTVDGKLNPATLAALQAFQAKHGGVSKAVPSIEPGSATIRALVAAAFPAAQRLMHLPQGTASAISERDYDEAAQNLNCEAAAVKAVAAVESAGRGFWRRENRRSSSRPTSFLARPNTSMTTCSPTFPADIRTELSIAEGKANTKG
jgi:peptidoglycan hydrolase-like protein with peptidoglycan-binding domain